MPFGALSSAHQIMVLLALKGGPEYAAQAEKAAAATSGLGAAVLRTSAAMDVSTKRSFLHNQALYTARRYAFYGTLAVTGLAYAVGKLGVGYLSTMQTARSALSTIFPNQKALDGVIGRLYKISTLSPFLFQDTLGAFRTLYPAFHAAGISATDAINSIQAAANGLAVAGKLTTGQLTRIGVQLQHMANIGRPTGQVLLALARDGLPVYAALRKEFHLTGTSLSDIANSGLTAQQVIRGLNKYMMTTAPYAGAATRISMNTLQGNWQMFKDILAQASGSAVGGLFGGLQNVFKRMNESLVPLVVANKPVGMYQIAAAIDHALSPSTHTILNLFIMLTTALKTLIVFFGVLAKAIHYTLYPVSRLLDLFGMGHAAARLFGVSIGLLTGLFVVYRSAIILNTLAEDAWKVVVAASTVVAKIRIGVIRALNFLWNLMTGETLINTAAQEANTLSMREQYDAMIAKNAIMGETVVATEAATGATFGLGVAFDALLGPIGLVIAALTAIIILHKQIAALPPVRGFLSFVQHPIRGIHNIRHHPGHAGHTALDFIVPEIMIAKHLFGGAFATGGRMTSAGYAMVGERGPEMVHLPAGSQITPLNRLALDGAGTLAIHVYPQDIYLEGRKFATVMADVVTDKEARK